MLTAADVDPSIVARYAWGRYSQNGEDGVLAYVLSFLPDVPRTCFEIGGTLRDGNPECNTANLLANGWKGWIVDAREWVHPWFRQMRVTAANVAAVERNAHGDLGVLSIDVDGIDFWLWKAWPDDKPTPAVVVIEYNSTIPNDVPQVIPYDPAFAWDGSDYFGANAHAMIRLGREKGYFLAAAVACLNLVFVREDLWEPSRFGHMAAAPWSAFGPVVRHPTDTSGRRYVNPFEGTPR